MQTFTASIELDVDQVLFLEITAAFFKMDMKAFLAAALASGIAHAEESMAQADMAKLDRTTFSDLEEEDLPF